MWELDCEESWGPKNWWFWIVVLKKTLESTLDCKEIKPGSPKGNQSWIFIRIFRMLMLKLKLQYFGHLMPRANSLEKTLMLEKTEGRGEGDNRGWDAWLASLTQWTWVWAGSVWWWSTGKPGVPQFMGWHRVRHDWPTQQQQQQATLLVGV